MSIDSIEASFQRDFFKALKYKAINQPKQALNYLDKCEQVYATDDAVSFVKGQIFSQLYQSQKAQEYYLKAMEQNPNSSEYIQTFAKVNKDKPISFFKTRLSAIYRRSKIDYQEVLMHYWARHQQWERLDEAFIDWKIKPQERAYIQQKYLRQPKQNVIIEDNKQEGKLKIQRLTNLISQKEISQVYDLANEQLSLYPSQPFFYYAYGWALMGMKRGNNAIEHLEMGLSFLVSDRVLEQKFYKELAKAYQLIGDMKQSDLYLQKTKQ